MRTILAIGLVLLIPLQEPSTEATQKKIAALMKELHEIMKKMNPDPLAEPDPKLSEKTDKIEEEIRDLAMKATGGKDEKKAERFVMESLARFAPEILEEMKRGALETGAASNLRMLALHEMTFLSEDSDGNRKKDFWVADVSGLQRLMPESTGRPIKLFKDNDAVALADAKPSVPLDKEGEFVASDGSKLRLGKLGAPKAMNSYHFAVIPEYVDAAGKTVKFDTGNGRNPERFAFCAYPAEYGKPCKKTFVVDTSGAVLGKDNGGVAVKVLPADLAKDGWK